MGLHIRFLIFLSVFFLCTPLTAMAIEEPKYELLEKSDDFELRQYHPMIIAEVLVEGDMDQASSKGFRLIADYIFGNNVTRTGGSGKIDMTASVTVEPKSEKILMTAPVTVEQASGQWQVHFVMPSKYTLDTLPIPNNPQVVLREVPARKVAVVRFSGIANQAKIVERTQELLAWMSGKHLILTSTPELARYNPPWTPPFLRRNEIMVEYQTVSIQQMTSI